MIRLIDAKQTTWTKGIYQSGGWGSGGRDPQGGKPVSQLKSEDLVQVDVPGGVVFKRAAYMAPMNAPDTLLFNISKLKAHAMGISAAVKNLQGIMVQRKPG